MSKRDLLLVAAFLITFVSLVSWLGRPGGGIGREQAVALVSEEGAGPEALPGAPETEVPGGVEAPDLEAILSPRRERGYPWDLIVVHHSGAARGDASSIRASPRAPHFVIGNGTGMGMGEIVATELWQEQVPGTHAGAPAIDRRAVGITLVGDYSRRDPPTEQIAAARHLITALRKRMEIPAGSVLRHDELGAMATLCPGRIPVTELARGGSR
jgi:hypothetical protein